MNNREEVRELIEVRPTRGLFDLRLGAVWAYRDLLYYLVWREIKVRYRQALLGIAWAIIQPLFAVLIFTVIFGHFAKFPSDGVPYAVFAFAATLPWTYFAEATQRSANSLVADSDLIRKIYFPRLIVPLAMVLAPLVDFAVAFVVFLFVLLYYGQPLTMSIFLLPVFLLVSILLSFAMGLLLAPINVKYRDVKHTLPFLMQIWMYATPIVYPITMVPEKWKVVYSLNPMVGVIEGFRWALSGKAAPDFESMLVSGIVILFLLASAVIYFHKNESTFADVI